MYYDYCQETSFQDCFQSLKHCFGDQSPSKATVFRWFRQFMSEARTLEDDNRCGRMAPTVTPENVSRIFSPIKRDAKVTYAEIQDIMKISSGSLTRILHDCLGVRKSCARWVPHNLSEEQKLLEDRKTVTADWYVNHCLPKVFQAWCKRRPRTGVRGPLLHHDNASAHTAAVTLDFLVANDVQLVIHPRSSPDLAPCDWFLFPSVKWLLKGKQF